MTPQAKIDKMRDIFEGCLNIAKAKGRDYSGDQDGMKNFRTFGWKGIVVRLNDKMERIVQFAKSGSFQVKDESIEDTLKDLINYAALTLIMYREEQQKPQDGLVRYSFPKYQPFNCAFAPDTPISSKKPEKAKTATDVLKERVESDNLNAINYLYRCSYPPLGKNCCFVRLFNE